jgi:DNA-binding response OmpR family regulator
MNIVCLGTPAVPLPVPGVIYVVDEFDFLRLLKLDPSVIGVFMCTDRQHGNALAKNVRVDGIKNPLFCLVSGPQADHRAIATILASGADQVEYYPIDARLFVAQLEAVCRRAQPRTSPTVHLGDVTFDPQTGVLKSPKGDGYLTRQESQVLQMITDAPDRLVTKSYIESFLNHTDSYSHNSNITSVIVCKIRKKLGKLTDRDYVASVWGKGFKFVPAGFEPEILTYKATYVREAAE